MWWGWAVSLGLLLLVGVAIFVGTRTHVIPTRDVRPSGAIPVLLLIGGALVLFFAKTERHVHIFADHAEVGARRIELDLVGLSSRWWLAEGHGIRLRHRPSDSIRSIYFFVEKPQRDLARARLVAKKR